MNKEIKLISIKNIKPNNWNPNSFSDSRFEKLIKSIEKDGLINPIIVYQDDDQLIIIDGEHRYKAFKALRKKKIDCYVLDQLSLHEAQRLNYVLNKLKGDIEDEDKDFEVITNLLDNYELEELLETLPYSDIELQHYLDEKFDDLEEESIQNEIDSEKENNIDLDEVEDKKVTVRFSISDEDYSELWLQIVTLFDNDVKKDDIFLELCRSYIKIIEDDG